MQSQLLRAWKLEFTTSHRVPSLNVPCMTWMDAYMAILLDARLGTCVERRVKQEARPNS
jgi:hypothetical protein